MTESKAVVTIDDISEKNAPAIYVKGGLLQFLDAVKGEVSAEVPDLTTKKGRDRIASLAAKVSKSKVAVERPGREYLARLKEMPKVVEAELREFVRSMDALRDETRAPLTAWEDAEAARVARHETFVEMLKNAGSIGEFSTGYTLRASIAGLESTIIDASLDEFEAEAHRVKDKALTALREALVIRERHEAELAAIAKFQAEQAERDQKEREERIAREAVEAERIAAEQRAHAAREAAAQREADLIEQAAQAQRQAEQEKRDAAAAAEQARLNAELAEQRRIAAEKQAELDRVAAEQRLVDEKLMAVAEERRRQKEEQARVEAETKAREANKAHKTKILGAAKEALMSMNITEELAKAIVLKIARGEVPNVTIQF